MILAVPPVSKKPRIHYNSSTTQHSELISSIPIVDDMAGNNTWTGKVQDVSAPLNPFCCFLIQNTVTDDADFEISRLQIVSKYSIEAIRVTPAIRRQNP